MGTTWLLVSGSKYDHTGITTGCVSCHGGATAGAMSKPSGHIPTGLGCEVCHRSTVAFGPGTPMNHLGIASGCATCHGGTYAGVMAKPTNHVPTTAGCESCHKNTTAFSAWTMNYTGIVNGCVTCHGGTYAGVMTNRRTTSRRRLGVRPVIPPLRPLEQPRSITSESSRAVPRRGVITEQRRASWANRRQGISQRRNRARSATRAPRPSPPGR